MSRSCIVCNTSVSPLCVDSKFQSYRYLVDFISFTVLLLQKLDCALAASLESDPWYSLQFLASNALQECPWARCRARRIALVWQATLDEILMMGTALIVSIAAIPGNHCNHQVFARGFHHLQGPRIGRLVAKSCWKEQLILGLRSLCVL